MTPRQLLIRPFAQLDIAEAALWYEQKQAGLADQFLRAVHQQIDVILERPGSFPIRYGKDIRRALVNRFPYAICFIDTGQAISVLSIFHTAQDHPRRLMGRR